MRISYVNTAQIQISLGILTYVNICVKSQCKHKLIPVSMRRLILFVFTFFNFYVIDSLLLSTFYNNTVNHKVFNLRSSVAFIRKTTLPSNFTTSSKIPQSGVGVSK